MHCRFVSTKIVVLRYLLVHLVALRSSMILFPYSADIIANVRWREQRWRENWKRWGVIEIIVHYVPVPAMLEFLRLFRVHNEVNSFTHSLITGPHRSCNYILEKTCISASWTRVAWYRKQGIYRWLHRDGSVQNYMNVAFKYCPVQHIQQDPVVIVGAGLSPLQLGRGLCEKRDCFQQCRNLISYTLLTVELCLQLNWCHKFLLLRTAYRAPSAYVMII